MRRRLFLKSYLSTALLVVFSFFIVGGFFLVQIDRYTMTEKENLLSTTAHLVSQQAALVSENYTEKSDLLLKTYLARTAKQHNVTILMLDVSGNFLLGYDTQGAPIASNGELPQNDVISILSGNTFFNVSSLGGFFDSPHYTAGEAVIGSDGGAHGIVLLCTDSEAVVGILHQVSDTFVSILLIVLIFALLISYFMSRHLTAPLKTMALAARAYAQGDFTTRVPENNRCDEIDELAISFNNMARDLEQLNDLTSAFIGNVSHELKTPMTTIGGFVDGMLDGTIPQDQQERYLRIISEEVQRLSRMTMRMLDAAKIQSGELILNPAPFDFTEMSTQIILSFEQKINAKHLEVEVDFSDRIMVVGDRDHVFRAVYNLVDNAVKFIDNNGKLRLSAYPAGAFCEFSISNTGEGISAEDLPHLFDRFYKTDRSRSRDRSGAGLGLYIVKNIINLHGGDISVRSSGGETEFSLTLPMAIQTKPKASTGTDIFTNSTPV